MYIIIIIIIIIVIIIIIIIQLKEIYSYDITLCKISVWYSVKNDIYNGHVKNPFNW
jgi:hypothetical protein